MGFQKSEADPNLYFIVVGGDPLILLLYVDDLFITGGEKPITVCKRDLASKYEMTNCWARKSAQGRISWQAKE